MRIAMALMVLLSIGAQSKELTLHQVWEYALNYNPKIKSVSYDKDIALSNLENAKSAYRPYILLNMDYHKIDGDRAAFYQGMNPELKGTIGAKITQKLFSLDASTNIAKAQISQTMAKLHKDSAQMELAYTVGTTIINYAFSQVALTIYNEKAKRIKDYLKIAKDRYHAGTIDIGDVYRWESELSKIESTILEAKNGISTSKNLLKNYMGMPQSETIEIIFLESDLEAFANINDCGAFKNPNIELLHENIKSDNIEAKNIKRSYYTPNLSLYGDTQQMIYNEGKGSQLPPSQNQNNYTIGMEINLSLYDGGARKARKEILQTKQLQTQSDIQVLQDELSKEQQSALNSIKSYQRSLEFDIESANKAVKYRNSKHQQYQEGVIDITPFLDAEEYATLATLNIEQKKYLIMQYKLSLAYALGRLQSPF